MIQRSQAEIPTGMSLTVMLLLAACGGNDGPAGDSATEGPATSGNNWIQCATEGGTCAFSGTRAVRYGTSSSFNVVTATAGVACSNGVFGDPAVGELKTCWYAGDGVSAAPTSPTPTSPAPTPPALSSGPAGPRITSFTSSGPIVASAGQVISGVRIQNPGGACITIPAGATGVTVRDSDIGPCGGSGNIVIEGANATVEFSFVHNGNRGVIATRTSGVVTRQNTFDTFYGPKFNGTAIEYDYMSSGQIDGNVVTGRDYASDAVSVYESSNIRLTNNTIDITVAEPSAAAFTMGDSTSGKPGSNNYVAGNIVRQSGGVPAGVFGSNGNTVLEKNCLTAGIQAYNYSGVFHDVAVRSNVINMGASFVPDTSVVAGWTTNINSTNCSLVPK
mgnify:CR=1 FL=1